ncbi:TPA: hypothetical protein ACKFH8_005565, partial [Burkholderia multivorans]
WRNAHERRTLRRMTKAGTRPGFFHWRGGAKRVHRRRVRTNMCASPRSPDAARVGLVGGSIITLRG